MAFAPDGSGFAAPVPQPIDVRNTYGQSDASNAYPDYGTYGLNHRAILAPKAAHVGGAILDPGPLGNGAYGQDANVIGVATYQSTDVFSVGRCAVIAQQLFRARNGNPTRAYLEFCTAVPGSAWTNGNGGGLGPGASFSGVIVNDALTVSNFDGGIGAGTVTPTQVLNASGIAPGTVIVSDDGGNQGNGAYTVGIIQFVPPGTRLSSAHATFIGNIGAGNAAAGSILEVESIIGGTVTIGDIVTGGTTLANTRIVSQIDGATGGVGHYTLYVGSPQNLTSRPMTTTGTGWSSMLMVLNSLKSYPVLPSPQYQAARFVSFAYNQNTTGRIGVSEADGKIIDLTGMLSLMDSYDLPGAGTTGMIYYLTEPGTVSNGTLYSAGEYATQTFCRTNAPGRGGPWSGRCFGTAYDAQWPWNGESNIHLDQHGQIRLGEWEGYVGNQVEDQGNRNWTPLWASMVNPVSISGQKVVFAFDRPNSPDFSGLPLEWRSDPRDGIKIWPNYGFHVYSGNTDLPIASVTIVGMTVEVVVTPTLVPGTVLEVSYAYRGPGGPNPGTCSGVGGNLCMRLMGASVLLPGESLDAWAWPFIGMVTV